MTDCGGTCTYVARKEDPSNWHGEKPDDWVLDIAQPLGLEQKKWECPHDALNDREYCAFHTQPDDLPAEIDEGKLFVNAINESSASDDELARRKKEFVGATFGAFDIGEVTLDAGDNNPIRLDHAAFTAEVRAEGTVFEHGISAQSAKFETSGQYIPDELGFAVSFSFAEFNGDGHFLLNGAEFSGDGDLSFFHATFNGDGEVSFGGATFNGDGDLRFNYAKFYGDGNLSFRNAKFEGDGHLLFNCAKFNGGGHLLFTYAKFNGDGDLSFKNAKFAGDGGLSFYEAKCNGEGHLSFEEAEIGRPCDFSKTQFKPAKRMIFSGANIRELLTFGTDLEGQDIREVREKLNFSDAVISGQLRFRSSKQSTARQLSEDKNDEQERLDVVFAETIDFRGATFEKSADFSSTQFLAEANFRDAQIQNTDFQDADLSGPENTFPADFYKADLSGVNFSNANLTGASFERAVLNRAELLGADLTRTKLYGALLGDARFNRETKFWLSPDASDRVPDDSLLPVRFLRAIKAKLRLVSRRDGSEPYCVYDPRYRGSNGETNLEKAAEVYGTLETLARQQSQPELASDCFLGRKDIQLKQYRKDRNWLMIARSMVPNVVARYGESPLRVLGTAAVTISVCGLAYYSFGLIEHTGTEEPATLFESFYFSALTFTTLGYGDFNPITTGGQVLAVAETSMGVILLAILVFVFGRRATR